VPAGARIDRRAMLVASAERGGLYANLTQIVEFEEPDAELARRLRACEEILARMRDEATRPGRTLAEALADCRLLRRGRLPGRMASSPPGRANRLRLARADRHPGQRPRDRARPGFCLEPSVTGAKAEETFVLTEAGHEIVAGAQLSPARA
jgi:hypothetical protein